MKQVSKSKYNKEYFKITKFIDYSKKINFNDFNHIHRQIATLENIDKNDCVVDFGCGAGDLAFCLFEKYKCRVIGIDYSDDAIKICRQKLDMYKKVNKSCQKISFLNLNNDSLPVLSEVKAVFFCDVLEHMHDDEIKIVLDMIKTWNKNSKIKLMIHTDNNLFLKFIRPAFDLISIILSKQSSEDILKRNSWENERHINLTNPIVLEKKMKMWSFNQLQLKYSQLGKSMIKDQLGAIGDIDLIVDTILVIYKSIKFLSPGFYSVYQQK